MGMKNLFVEQKSNLSGITKKKQLYVSEIFHKSFIEVNEKGSEAAAAAGLGITYCSDLVRFRLKNLDNLSPRSNI